MIKARPQWKKKKRKTMPFNSKQRFGSVILFCKTPGMSPCSRKSMSCIFFSLHATVTGERHSNTTISSLFLLLNSLSYVAYYESRARLFPLYENLYLSTADVVYLPTSNGVVNSTEGGIKYLWLADSLVIVKRTWTSLLHSFWPCLRWAYVIRFQTQQQLARG